MPRNPKRLCILTVSSVIQEEEETSSFLVASSGLSRSSVVVAWSVVGCPCREASDGRGKNQARAEYLNCVRQAIYHQDWISDRHMTSLWSNFFSAGEITPHSPKGDLEARSGAHVLATQSSGLTSM